ncbi:MAG: sigma 54-interacting transcriptional regulator [Leptospirillum sp.]
MEGHFGESPAFSRMLATIHRVAHLSSTLLHLQINRSGKERVSQTIHKSNPHASKPFEAVDCSGLPEIWLKEKGLGTKKRDFTGDQRLPESGGIGTKKSRHPPEIGNPPGSGEHGPGSPHRSSDNTPD